MAEYITPIKRLIEEFRKLPGVGAKTAVRYAFATLALALEKLKTIKGERAILFANDLPEEN